MGFLGHPGLIERVAGPEAELSGGEVLGQPDLVARIHGLDEAPSVPPAHTPVPDPLTEVSGPRSKTVRKLVTAKRNRS